MRTFLLALLSCTALPAAATPILYDLEYQVTTVNLPSPIYGTVNLADTFHVSLAWDWDAALGAPNADTRSFSYGMAEYDMSIGSLHFSDTIPGQMWFFRTPFTSIALLEDEVTDCQFSAGPAAGTSCEDNALFVDEIDFNFQCADWAGATHAIHTMDCASGMVGTLAIPIKDFSNGYSVEPGDRDGVMIGSLRQVRNVPEPDSMALFASALFCSMLIRRRRAPRLRP